MSDQEHKQKIWGLIKGISTGMLTTVHDTELRARPMHLVQKEYDGTLWFYTDLNAEKVLEIEKDHEVCVAFSDPKSDTYVSLTGTAKITNNHELIEKFWNPFISAWFPEGKEADNVGLIEVKIRKGEHWNSESSKMVQFFKIAKANVQDDTPNMGEHEEFGT